jgi:hypothetical protein
MPDHRNAVWKAPFAIAKGVNDEATANVFGKDLLVQALHVQPTYRDNFLKFLP